MSKRQVPIGAAVQCTPASSGSVDMAAVTGNTRYTKRLHVSFASSMSNFFAEGSGSAVWSILPDRASKLFGEAASDMASSLNAIKNAFIVNCKLLQVKSTFPVPIGVTVNCIPPLELTDTGQAYAFTVFPASMSDAELLLFEADMNSSENNQWRINYRAYNKDNLSTHNILDVHGMPYKFVHESHPVIAMIIANKELLGEDISTHNKIDGEWYKIGTQVLNTALAALNKKIIAKLPCQDLSNLQVQLSRVDTSEWNEHSDYLAEYMSPTDEESIFDRACTFMCRLEITYELPK